MLHTVFCLICTVYTYYAAQTTSSICCETHIQRFWCRHKTTETTGDCTWTHAYTNSIRIFFFLQCSTRCTCVCLDQLWVTTHSRSDRIIAVYCVWMNESMSESSTERGGRKPTDMDCHGPMLCRVWFRCVLRYIVVVWTWWCVHITLSTQWSWVLWSYCSYDNFAVFRTWKLWRGSNGAFFKERDCIGLWFNLLRVAHCIALHWGVLYFTYM